MQNLKKELITQRNKRERDSMKNWMILFLNKQSLVRNKYLSLNKIVIISKTKEVLTNLNFLSYLQ